MAADFNSPYYPYEKVQTGFSAFRGMELIPYQILRYLMDLPDSRGYEPADDNTRPRVRLMKYLYWDVENPLAQRLPTAKEKLSMLYDGEEPSLNTDEQRAAHPQGYRLYPQALWPQSGTEGKQMIKLYLGRTVPIDDRHTALGLTFDITSSSALDGNTGTQAYSRAVNMEQCILEALHGVNVAGIGVIDFAKSAHGDNGSRALYDTAGLNVGRELRMSVLWCDSEMEAPETWN